MNKKEMIKKFAVSFATWIDEECFQSVDGYIIREIADDSYPQHSPEYTIEELYDYFLQTEILNHDQR